MRRNLLVILTLLCLAPAGVAQNWECEEDSYGSDGRRPTRNFYGSGRLVRCRDKTHHDFGCTGLRGELTFLFGSCRRFFEEPCLETVARPKRRLRRFHPREWNPRKHRLPPVVRSTCEYEPCWQENELTPGMWSTRGYIEE